MLRSHCEASVLDAIIRRESRRTRNMAGAPKVGDFVRLRTRRWLVEGERLGNQGLRSLRLACVDDDAQGELADILWDAELDAEVLRDDGWATLSQSGTDDPTVFAAYIRTLRWNTATAADRDLFQAPFRAGIRLDAYQLLPLRKSLRLPRVNLLIADDVGAGKTVEAGLVLREMLLRRRVDFVVVADLRHFGERFPERVVEPIKLSGLSNDAPALLLARMLADYGEAVRARAAGLPPRQAANARLSIVGLQQRLLSSVAAFAHTLEVHLRGLQRAETSVSLADAEAYVAGPAEAEDEALDEAAAEARTDAEQDEATEAAAALAAPVSDRARVEAMLTIARSHASRPDARLRWLAQWIRANFAPGGRWNDRRLVLFTEFEDTRRWLQKRLGEALDDLNPDDRMAAFTGVTTADRREDLKRRFNADPANDPLRILICTDAAREGTAASSSVRSSATSARVMSV
jgi:hypothetical protein